MMPMISACKEIRENILKISNRSGHGHIPTSFSIVEMLYATYDSITHDPANPAWGERDIFVLSKGHAALGLYCVLAHFGYFQVEEVNRFGAFGSNFGCHPDRLKVPGVEVSTGSLGHGIGIGVGIACALQLRGATHRQVITLIGDGEANEGSVWEAIMVATDLGLHNFTILYDNNQSQRRSLQIHNPSERFQAFGCQVLEVNGHEVETLKAALTQPTHGVKAIVANTVKGYGCQTLVANVYEWHRKSPDREQLALLMRELDAQTV
ncbi:Apulose-4-phosphate transketolase subunit A [Candidatus Entotheonellaceae bacterium PAL068K]